MPHFAFVWTDKNIRHLADNALDPEDAETAMADPESRFVSDSSGRRAVRGYACDGRYIAVIFEQIDELTVYVVTAYEI
jgi:hypothetical protein